MWYRAASFFYYSSSTERATPPKSTKSRNSDSLVSRSTNSNWDFGIWIGAKDFERLDWVGFGGVAFLVETGTAILVRKCAPGWIY